MIVWMNVARAVEPESLPDPWEGYVRPPATGIVVGRFTSEVITEEGRATWTVAVDRVLSGPPASTLTLVALFYPHQKRDGFRVTGPHKLVAPRVGSEVVLSYGPLLAAEPDRGLRFYALAAQSGTGPDARTVDEHAEPVGAVTCDGGLGGVPLGDLYAPNELVPSVSDADYEALEVERSLRWTAAMPAIVACLEARVGGVRR